MTELRSSPFTSGTADRAPAPAGHVPDSATAARGGTSTPVPVLVLNPYYTGVGIARSLRGRGVKVAALTSEPDAPGARSRHFDAVHVVANGRDAPEALFGDVARIAAGFGQRPVIFPTRDFDVLFLCEYWDRLAPHVLLPYGNPQAVRRLMDKAELPGIAAQLGVATPVTVTCTSGEDVQRAAATLRFPAVIKPRFAYQWRHQGLWERVGAQKAFIAPGERELVAHYERIAAVTPEVLVQEYIAGEDSDIVVCCCVAGAGGRVLGQFTGRKLLQNPPYVGTGCVVEAAPVAQIVTPSAALLAGVGYRGIAELEFKHDRARDAYFLIEVNPRHWDQHELGRMVGIDITGLAYDDITGAGAPGPAPQYLPAMGRKWIAETELAVAAARAARDAFAAHRAQGRRAAWRAAWRSVAGTRALLRGRRMYAMARLSDPAPGAVTLWRLARAALRALGRRRRG